MTPTISLIDAPSNLGLAPPALGKEPGVRRMAQTLRQLGVQKRLGALNGGEVMPPRYSPERDVTTGIRNAFEIADYSAMLARAVGAQLDAGHFPVVLGGDCSILLGSLLALHRRGRYALLFLDGHHDLQTPHVSRTGGAAGMDLALAVGIGPPLLAALGGPAPLVHPADVFMLGVRDDPVYYTGDDVRQARMAMHVHYLDELRRTGMAAMSEAIATQIARSGATGAWIHIDVDVLDDAVMPAVDSRQAGGLSYDELHALLRPALDSGRVAGMHLTIYDPDLDPEHRAGQLLVDNLGRLLAR
jgi:arginase